MKGGKHLLGGKTKIDEGKRPERADYVALKLHPMTNRAPRQWCTLGPDKRWPLTNSSLAIANSKGCIQPDAHACSLCGQRG